MSRKGTRRRWTAEQRLRTLLAGMQNGVEVSDLRRREGINPTMVYARKKKLLSSAVKIFDESSSRPTADMVRTETEPAQMKSVVADITAENLKLNKTCSG